MIHKHQRKRQVLGQIDNKLALAAVAAFEIYPVLFELRLGFRRVDSQTRMAISGVLLPYPATENGSHPIRSSAKLIVLRGIDLRIESGNRK